MKKIITFATALCLPAITKAKEYSPLIDMPGDLAGGNNIDSYINNLYVFTITIAGLLAVIKIIVGGVKWMMSDVVTQKAQAIKDIQSALLGLIIVLSAVVILSVINPNLVKMDLSFRQIQAQPPSPIKVTSTGSLAPLKQFSAYDSIDLTSTSEKSDISTFEKMCKDSGGTYKVFRSEIRCYKNTSQKKLWTPYLCSANTTTSTCDKNIQKAKSDCEARTNGKFTVDERRDYGDLYGSCVYTP